MGYELEPNRLVLGWTRERVNLKPHARVAARVEGKSSLARLGLAVHITAPRLERTPFRPDRWRNLRA